MLTTLVRAWWPTLRALPRATLAGVAAVAATPAALVLVRGGADYRGALVVAAVVAGGAAAFAVDDPAGETVAASPTPRRVRHTIRLSAILAGAALLAAALVGLAVVVGDVTAADLGRRAAELAATSGLAAAAAGVADRRRLPSSGAGGAVVGVVGVLLVASFAYRYPALPALLSSPVHGRWWIVAGVGWALAAWSWRDPAR